MRAAVLVVALVALLPVARVAIGGGGAATQLRSIPAQRADARVDATVTDQDVALLGTQVERAISYVEELFQQHFAAKPKLVLFGTTAAFGEGLASIFDYSEGDAARSASSYGGLYDHATSTIAVNLATIAADDRASTLEHELTHLLVRETTGRRQLPAWFEEGIATRAERHEGATRWREEDALIGHALAASGRISLARLETLSDWHAIYPQFGQALYLYAEHVFSQMRFHDGWAGLLDLLAEVGRGSSFADAYRATSGESVDDLDARVTQDHSARIVSRRLPSGDAQYTVYTGRPLAEEKITIGGKSSYAVTFTVMTDDLGVYRGTFGSTAPPGAYSIGAASVRADITTTR